MSMTQSSSPLPASPLAHAAKAIVDKNLAGLDQLPPRVLASLPVHLMEKRKEGASSKTAIFLSSVRNALGDVNRPVIHLIDLQRPKRAGIVALDLANAAARGGERVLMIETIGATGKSLILGNNAPAQILPLNQALHSTDLTVSPFLTVQGTSLFFATLKEPEAATLSDETRAALINRIRELFNRVILFSPASLAMATASTYSRYCDGSVVIAEAERTRHPVALNLAKAIEVAGGRVLGGVLTRRSYYIPRMIYGLLFSGGR